VLPKRELIAILTVGSVQNTIIEGIFMNRIQEKAKLLQRETIELGQYINKYRLSTSLCFLAAAVFVCWPDVNIKKSGVEKYVVNLGKCFIITAGIVTYADKARKIGL
jgi:hypothetical protein